MDHTGHRARVRARFRSEGLDGFEPHEVLELLLFYAIPRADTKPIAYELLNRYGSLSAVLEADPMDLQQVPGVGEGAAVLLALMAPLTRKYQMDRYRDKPFIKGFADAGKYALALMEARRYEVFMIVFLDAQQRLLGTTLLGEGTLDESPAYVRLAVEAGMRHKAHSCLLTHNHPGGTLRPSMEDMRATAAMVTAMGAVGITVHDHIIVADGRYYSMANNRQLGGVPVDYDIGMPPEKLSAAGRSGVKVAGNRGVMETPAQETPDE